MSNSDKGAFSRSRRSTTVPAGPSSEGPASTRPPTLADAAAWAPTRQHPTGRPASVLEAWQPTRVLPATARPGNPHETWQATRTVATQVMADEDEYLSGEAADIGRQTTAVVRELFVSCAAAEALQQQFEHRRPEFIGLHEISTNASRQLLAGIAAATGRALQQLVIRRQGQGTPLATLPFIDLPTTDQRPLRLYTVQADVPDRDALGRVLLAYSRLGVVMIGDLPGPALEAALQPLHEAIMAGSWPGRHLLLLPLGAAGPLAIHGPHVGRGTGVAVRTTPQVVRPVDAWAFIAGTWGRLRQQAASEGTTVPDLARLIPTSGTAASSPAHPAGRGRAPRDAASSASETPIRLTLPGALAAPSVEEPAADTAVERYVRRISELAGVTSCCVFEIASGQAKAHAGAVPDAESLGRSGMSLMTALRAGAATLGIEDGVPEAAITLASHHQLLRGLPTHPGLALHALLDKTQANLTLARLQLARLDAVLEGSAPA